MYITNFLMMRGRVGRLFYLLFTLPPILIIVIGFYNFLNPEEQLFPVLSEWIMQLIPSEDELLDKSQELGINHILKNLGLIVFFFMYINVTTQRSHDRNKSGYWQLLYFLPNIFILLAVFLKIDLAIHVDKMILATSYIITQIISVIVGLWLFVELSFFRGTDGPNQYGTARKYI